MKKRHSKDEYMIVNGRKIKRVSDEENAEIMNAAASDPDNPIIREEDIKSVRPATEVFAEMGITPPKPRGRPKATNPKEQVTLRIDQDVLEKFKATGKGWQTKINQALRDAEIA